MLITTAAMFDDLSPKLLGRIASFLPAPSVHAFFRTCKATASICSDPFALVQWLGQLHAMSGVAHSGCAGGPLVALSRTPLMRQVLNAQAHRMLAAMLAAGARVPAPGSAHAQTLLRWAAHVRGCPHMTLLLLRTFCTTTAQAAPDRCPSYDGMAMETAPNDPVHPSPEAADTGWVCASLPLAQALVPRAAECGRLAVLQALASTYGTSTLLSCPAVQLPLHANAVASPHGPGASPVAPLGPAQHSTRHTLAQAALAAAVESSEADVAKWLLHEGGAETNSGLLIRAAELGDTRMVALLLQRLTECSILSSRDWMHAAAADCTGAGDSSTQLTAAGFSTALAAAASRGHVETLQVLLQHAGRLVPHVWLRPPLMAAAVEGRRATAALLLRALTSAGNEEAARMTHGPGDCACSCAEDGTDRHASPGDGRVASRSGVQQLLDEALLTAVTSGNLATPSVVALLLQHGANPNASSNVAAQPEPQAAGSPPSTGEQQLTQPTCALALAAGSSDPTTVRLLLDFGASPNARGGAALAAVIAQGRSSVLLRQLLEAGANPDPWPSGHLLTQCLLSGESDWWGMAHELLAAGARPDPAAEEVCRQSGVSGCDASEQLVVLVSAGARPAVVLRAAVAHGITWDAMQALGHLGMQADAAEELLATACAELEAARGQAHVGCCCGAMGKVGPGTARGMCTLCGELQTAQAALDGLCRALQPHAGALKHVDATLVAKHAAAALVAATSALAAAAAAADLGAKMQVDGGG